MDWRPLDDKTFVLLVADLLRAEGFVDVLVHGDGPDGGLDVIATELVTFTFQGRRPFRWGIQCKFSSAGTARSVSDNEIRDVEGILRSVRYSAHGLAGYLLVSNRQITQNVVERLTGIDRSSPFRTAFVDGPRFETFLREHASLVAKYFAPLETPRARPPSLEFSFAGDGLLQIVASNPITHVRAECGAVIDTGASRTLMPRNLADELSVLREGRFAMESVMGVMHFDEAYVDLTIGADVVSRARVAVVEGIPHILIGRDILRTVTTLFDGPNNSVRIWTGD